MNWWVIGIGALCLLGTFATINSRSSSSFDHDLGLLLLIVGVVCIAFGTGVLDLDAFMAKWDAFKSGESIVNSE